MSIDRGLLAKRPSWSTAGGRRRRFLVPVLAGIITTLGSCNDNLSPNLPARIEIVAPHLTTAPVGSVVEVEVRVLNASGIGIAGTDVRFDLHEGEGSASSATEKTDQSGVARTQWTLDTLAGANALRVSVSAVEPLTLRITGTAGPAASLAKQAGDSQVARPGATTPVRPAVRVTDAHGNPVVGGTVTFAVGRGGGSVAGATAVTDAAGVATIGSWTLGPVTDINLLSASVAGLPSVTFSAAATNESPDITVRINRPKPGAGVGDQFGVEADVTSVLQLVSVRAKAGAAETDLALSQRHWLGILSIHAALGDTVLVVVTATDVNGATTEAVSIVVFDRRPTLTITSPADYEVAHPNVTWVASCSDDDPVGCQSLTVTTSGNTTLARGQATVSGTASLAAFDGQIVPISFSGTDSRGQSTGEPREVFVETSPRLTLLGSASGIAQDYRDVRMLGWSPGLVGEPILRPGWSPFVTIRHLVTRREDSIPIAPPLHGPAFLTPSGAIFVSSDSGRDYRLYDWRNGALSVTPLGACSTSLVVADNYAIFCLPNGDGSYRLNRRDLSTGADLTVATIVPDAYSVAANGDVAYWDGDYNVYRYRSGQTLQLTNATSSAWNVAPLTDGINVVYLRRTPCCAPPQQYELLVFDGTNTTVVVPATTHEVKYQVNGGWTAFTKVEFGGVVQVWTRSPAGVLRQVSLFNSASRLEALGADGSVGFSHGGRHYFVPPTGAAVDVGTQRFGTMHWRNGEMVKLIGRSVFRIVP